jgi:hypothetical protein
VKRIDQVSEEIVSWGARGCHELLRNGVRFEEPDDRKELSSCVLKMTMGMRDTGSHIKPLTFISMPCTPKNPAL